MENLNVNNSDKNNVYHKAKTWQIILFACNGLVGMSLYSLIGLASYSANVGYGIATVAVGGILTFTRILDAITDPLLAFVYDRVNTRWGKIRILIVAGWIIEAIALFCMFSGFSSKGHGLATFVGFYILYVIGYTMTNMTALTVPNLLTNDPKQRPTIGVWQTVFNYLVPITLSIALNVILLPKFGGTYNQAYLSAACILTLAVSALGVVLVCIGVSEYDKPENFKNITANKEEKLSIKDMVSAVKENKPFQCYIVAAASDKIAQQVASQSIVGTLLAGIVIGNMGLSTILNMIAILPAILFAVFGARYAGKHGNKESITTWTWACMGISAGLIAFFGVIDPHHIATFGPMMIIYVALTLILNGAKMCVTTANSAFVSDLIDYELDRTGKFIPAVMTGTYNLIDKIVSAFSVVIATGAVALVGYTQTLPQPGDPLTRSIFWMTMFLQYGLAMIGWICTIVAMRKCDLTKEEMVKVQHRISEKKKAAKECA
ncbi:MFS transporter [Butyrivibrio sp. AE3006]|uniref:MFS transporter n=1 Tax=Butyrivibrio sp. AE3006 TaxID=1280673 RepID=UPI0004285997|nr:MFS transporter [Butyrivibrio sp. AE3006]